ncbi:hypothetical protein B0H13DRAFT_2363130 [Mycena leptocephala]|nr:hypothetical protein B0H13DRAFT_2363130 [Mycena leptocephala]
MLAYAWRSAPPAASRAPNVVIYQFLRLLSSPAARSRSPLLAPAAHVPATPPHRVLGAPILRRQAYAHTRCLLALLGSLTPLALRPSSLQATPLGATATAPAPASLAAAALLDPPGGSCLRSLAPSFESPAPSLPSPALRSFLALTRIALVSVPTSSYTPRLLRRSFV